MPRKRIIPSDHPAFAPLPIISIPLSGGINAAIHVAGDLSSARLPLICLAGYQRNMSDFTEFVAYFRRMGGGSWPVILVDLPGRGRADDRKRTKDYNSHADADDVAAIMTALGVGCAVVLGQGHGGQIAMLLAANHPLMIAGTILLDAGPVTDSRGIVRLRNNMLHIDSLRGSKAVVEDLRRILGGDYPGLSDTRLDSLMGRTHYVDRRGRARTLFDPRLL
jgi:pimeloyl-ACP methyl ester carboxylesterase